MNKIKSLKSRRPVRQTAAASKTAIIIVIIIVIAFLLINPRVYTASVLAGFKLFANAVLPSLFP
ncbi:MAG: hypothetical protein LBQ40_01675, partial [Clostridiales bacterium]|nr:hypothetical protein [Clostridiales bacterium]